MSPKHREMGCWKGLMASHQEDFTTKGAFGSTVKILKAALKRVCHNAVSRIWRCRPDCIGTTRIRACGVLGALRCVGSTDMANGWFAKDIA